MIRIERRLENITWLGMLAPVVAVVFTLSVVAVMIRVSGYDPFATYGQMVGAAFTKPGALSATLLIASPLVWTGLCAAIAFRLKAYNIGGEGQLLIGAVAAAGAGLALGSQPQPIVLIGMMGAGVLGGALWVAAPTILRAYFHANEILTTLMLNYVAYLFAYYLIFDSHSYWRDTSPAGLIFPQGKVISETGWWPGLTFGSVVVPLGLVIGIAVAIILVLVLTYTRFGYRMRIISDSPDAGHNAGMRTKRTLVTVLLLSGGFAGFAGASQIGDFSHLLDPRALQQASYGYTGIVAGALGRYNPIGVVFAATFLGGITNAGFRLQGETLPLGLVGAMQGLMLLSVASAELLSRHKIVFRRGAGRRQVKESDSSTSTPPSAEFAADSGDQVK